VAFLVLTTHGRDLEHGRGLAPIAEAVTARARRPTLLVRPEAVAEAGGAAYPLKRMLLPIDGASGTAKGLRPALQLASRLGAAVDLLYVVHPGQLAPREPMSMTPTWYVDAPHHEWPGWADEVSAWLRACCDDLGHDVPMNVYVRRGTGEHVIATVISDLAEAHEADAIVLVRRSHLEAGRASVLRAVLELAPCPVLLVAGKPIRAAAPSDKPESVGAPPINYLPRIQPPHARG